MNLLDVFRGPGAKARVMGNTKFSEYGNLGQWQWEAVLHIENNCTLGNCNAFVGFISYEGKTRHLAARLLAVMSLDKSLGQANKGSSETVAQFDRQCFLSALVSLGRPGLGNRFIKYIDKRD